MGKHIQIPPGWWECAACKTYNVPTVEFCRCGCSKEFTNNEQKEREYVPECYKPKAKAKREPNKTEQEFQDWFLFGKGWYEAIKLRLKNGSVYTPDWVVFRDGVLWLYEIKGGYKHPSHGRSKMAFEQAKIDWPMFQFRWAEKRNGKWQVDE